VDKKPVIISACLLGISTRYDGGSSFNAEAVKEAGPLLVPVCPEQLGGMPTPRPACIIGRGTGQDVLDGKTTVTNLDGEDVTSSFLNGAGAVLEIALKTGAVKAVLKEKSPSCGVNIICRGARAISGAGVTAALLNKNGIKTIGF